ncbi:hypothetical protein KC19_10G006400 [Ceratodon purpureus]|uniref:Secreted protein n=1 Tax=Ceratodon purpureus TaxID=3225 RepID=A0A8T0GFC9_CERPU|nr:hypothetical protein KC19_10G006400 [Ceratodon purpureus]
MAFFVIMIVSTLLLPHSFPHSVPLIQLSRIPMLFAHAAPCLHSNIRVRFQLLRHTRVLSCNSENFYVQTEIGNSVRRVCA